jgi:aldose 1-epimerase
VHTVSIGAPDGLRIELLERGATVHRLLVPTADGPRNVVLGHRDLAGYVTGTEFHGATIGRFANRIAGGQVTVDGTAYQLDVNEGGTTLHGGSGGFDTRDWTVESVTGTAATLRLVSPDGDQGFPGELSATVTYTVGADTLDIELTATCDAPTPVSLTNHSYLNLDGEGAGSVEDHRLTVHADHYTPTDDLQLPTGEIASVAGTPFDLRDPARLGDVVRRAHPQLLVAHGVDHNLLPRGTGMREVAVLETADLTARLSTDAPGLQVYTGNYLDGTAVGTGGRVYRQGDGIALEPQELPDAPHHDGFGDVVLRPGRTFRRRIGWRFGT